MPKKQILFTFLSDPEMKENSNLHASFLQICIHDNRDVQRKRASIRAFAKFWTSGFERSFLDVNAEQGFSMKSTQVFLHKRPWSFLIASTASLNPRINRKSMKLVCRPGWRVKCSECNNRGRKVSLMVLWLRLLSQFAPLINRNGIFSAAYLTVAQFSFIRFAAQDAALQWIMQTCAVRAGLG